MPLFIICIAIVQAGLNSINQDAEYNDQTFHPNYHVKNFASNEVFFDKPLYQHQSKPTSDVPQYQFDTEKHYRRTTPRRRG